MYTCIIFTICFFLFVIFYCKSIIKIENDIDNEKKDEKKKEKLKPYIENDEFD